MVRERPAGIDTVRLGTSEWLKLIAFLMFQLITAFGIYLRIEQRITILETRMESQQKLIDAQSHLLERLQANR